MDHLKKMFHERLAQASQQPQFYLRDFVDLWITDFIRFLMEQDLDEHVEIQRFVTTYPSSHVLAWELVHRWDMHPLLIKTRVGGTIGTGFFASERMAAFVASLDNEHRGKTLEELTEEEYTEAMKRSDRLVRLSDEELLRFYGRSPGKEGPERKQGSIRALLPMENVFVTLVGPATLVQHARKAMRREVNLEMPIYRSLYIDSSGMTSKLTYSEHPLVVRYQNLPVTPDDLLLFYPWIRDAGFQDVQDLLDAYIQSLEPLLWLVGPPGTGKTMLALWMARLLWEQHRGWILYTVSFLEHYGASYETFKKQFEETNIANLVKFVRSGKHHARMPRLDVPGFWPGSSGTSH